jgi:1,4-dihydroxy-2-naphthoate octaprenyltransferase
MTHVTLIVVSRFGVWIRGMRLRTLSISIAPILAGTAHAAASFGRIAILPVLAATISAVAIQVATNLANDAADGERGLDGPARLGPPLVVGSCLMSPAEVRRGAVVATLVAALFGLFAVLAGGLPILLIGIASILAAWAYSNGPCPISATPLGEVFVVAYFGIAAVVGTEWLASGQVSFEAVLLGIAIGLPAAAVLTINNHRDRVLDAVNGRRTLSIVLGERGATIFYGTELVASTVLAALVVMPVAPRGALLVGACVLPALYLAVRVARMPISRALNGRLVDTVVFQLVLAVATVAALLGDW